jgi:large subunit ribosomal protein L25
VIDKVGPESVSSSLGATSRQFSSSRSSFVPEVKLTAELRTEFGKGAARRIRRAHKVPAVLYGHGTDPIHIALPGHETLLALRTANALLSIDVDGKSQLALPKQVQRDPIKHTIEHVDLVLVRSGEKVTVDIHIQIEGEAAPETLVVVDANSVAIEAEATHIPQQIVVSIEGLRAGTQILASDLTLPEGSALALDPETLIVNITAAQSEAAAEAELAASEAELGIEPTVADEPEEPAEDAESEA